MLNAKQTRFAKLVSELINCNPFLPLRIELERKALGKEFEESNANWNLHPSQHRETANLQRLYELARGILEECVKKDTSADSMSADEVDYYLDLVRFVVFHDYREAFEAMVADDGKSSAKTYRRFCKDWNHYCPPEKFADSVTEQMPHIFALLFQIRRAFNNVFRNIIGSCQSIIDLRADVWRSIFTHDVRRYYDTMHCAMSDFPTLITGPTGSGKELVARAIGLSGYVPFDTQSMNWATPISELYTSLNLSALSPTLIESELFGHAKGAFTGAANDRSGWLETCPEHGAVFLDEIGELNPEVQVKLLRVFEDRVFQRLGDTQPRHFQGRIIAATNRDLATEIQRERFRLDFYYRLCADRLQTPSLAVRCNDDSSELDHLVRHLMQRITNSEDEELVAACLDWISSDLSDHTWPGNVRELDQCIRSWLVRREYRPLEVSTAGDRQDIEACLAASKLSADELISLYCRVKYYQTKSYVKTAEALQMDRRTVKSRVTP